MTEIENKRIVNTALALKALREVGNRSTATAIAELVDNSIEAEADDIYVITQSRFTSKGGKRASYRVQQIAVLDNGEGMEPSDLENCLSLGWGTRLNSRKGLGRFGFGLKGASISQARRIDVYSWRNQRCYRTYLDLDEVEEQKRDLLPPLEKCEVPPIFREHFAEIVSSRGTLVVWSNLDKIDFSKPDTLLNRMEGDLCRIYRHFLDEDDTYGRRRNIMMCDIDLSGRVMKRKTVLKANDPLYLLEPSNVPGSDGKATNELFEEPYSINIEYEPGKFSNVELSFSIALPNTQAGDSDDKSYEKDKGHSALGKHYRKNMGISFVRAAREIDFGSFGFLKNSGDTRNRWWGAEVRFEPELDELFGVTNNKQQIRGFRRIDRKDHEYIESLTSIAEDEDNAGCFRARLHLKLNDHLEDKIGSMMSIIRKRKEGTRGKDGAVKMTDLVVEKVNKDVGIDRTKTSSTVEANKKTPIEIFEERYQFILETREDLSNDEQKSLTEKTLNYKVDIQKDDWGGSMFLDVKLISNAAVGLINTRSPYYEKFWEHLEDADDEQGINALKVMMLAYVRTEDELREYNDPNLFAKLRDRWGYWVSELLKYVGE